MSSSEGHEGALHAETRHGLVAEPPAGPGVAAEHKALLPDERAVRAENKHVHPSQLAGASCKHRQVVGVDEVLSKNDVTFVQQSSQSSDGQIPDAPFIVVFVGYPGVENEAPKGIRSLVDGTKRLNEQWRRAPGWDDLHNALRDPFS